MRRLYFQIQYITLKSQRLKLAKSELREKKKINNLKNVKISFLKSPHNREELESVVCFAVGSSGCNGAAI